MFSNCRGGVNWRFYRVSPVYFRKKVGGIGIDKIGFHCMSSKYRVIGYFNRRNFRERNFRELREFWAFSRKFISRIFSYC